MARLVHCIVAAAPALPRRRSNGVSSAPAHHVGGGLTRDAGICGEPEVGCHLAPMAGVVETGCELQNGLRTMFTGPGFRECVR